MKARRLAKRAGLAAALLSVLATLSGAWFFVHGNTVLTQCGSTPPGTSAQLRRGGVTTDFTLVPPGYDCVYRDRSGREIARRRATS